MASALAGEIARGEHAGRLEASLKPAVPAAR
jgi:hypothetical protein